MGVWKMVHVLHSVYAQRIVDLYHTIYIPSHAHTSYTVAMAVQRVSVLFSAYPLMVVACGWGLCQKNI